MKTRLALVAMLALSLAGCASNRLIRAAEYDQKIASGFVGHCKTVSEPDYIVSCEPVYTTQHQVRCPNDDYIILTAQDGSHWCMRTKR